MIRKDQYNGYMSGYESVRDIPMKHLLKVLAFPFFVSIACGYFLYLNQIEKKNEAWGWSSSSETKEAPKPVDTDRNKLKGRV